MVKVRLPFRYRCFDGENVWVHLLGPDIGEIANIPVFATRYKYRDVIRFDPDTWEFLGKVDDGGFTRTRLYEYTGDFDQEKARWESKGYVVESLAPKIFALSRKRLPKRVVTASC